MRELGTMKYIVLSLMEFQNYLYSGPKKSSIL